MSWVLFRQLLCLIPLSPASLAFVIFFIRNKG